jgi:hypothetical protein
MVNLMNSDKDHKDHEETIRDHNMNVKSFILSSIPSNGLEIASYGLSEPKTVSKKKSKVNSMTTKQIKTKAQDDEQTKTVPTQELVISSKAKVEKKTEVISMDKEKKVAKKRIVKKKATQRKQRKGKSLLTAFRINRMQRREVLNLDRTCIRGKYI